MNKNNKGFSIIEVLISISILAIAVAAPIKIIADDVLEASTSKYQLEAQFLAQEAIEVIRADRDTHLIVDPLLSSNILWSSVVDVSCMRDSNRCYLNTNAVVGGSGGVLSSSTTDDKFNVVLGNTTYKRVVKVDINADEMEIVVEVSWDDGDCSANTKCIELTSNLFNI